MVLSIGRGGSSAPAVVVAGVLDQMPDPKAIERDTELAALSSLGLAGAFKFFQSAGIHGAANPLPALAVEGLGLRVRPGGFVPRPTPLVLTWVAPQPIGITPPGYVGLPKDWLAGVDWIDLVENGADQQTTEGRQLAVARAAAAQLATVATRARELNDDQIRAALVVAAQLDQLRQQSEFIRGRVEITSPASALEAERNVRAFLRERGLDGSGNTILPTDQLQPPADGDDVAFMQRLQANNPPDP